MSEMKLSDLLARMRKRLAPKVGEREASAMARAVIEALKGWNAVGLAIHGDDLMSDYLVARTDEIVDRVLAEEPLQYVLGVAPFYGMNFRVTPAVLIPRPETSMLVDMIVARYKDCTDLRVLDLGTGSGCIAIALARNLKFAHVTAVDISDEALDVARENAAEFKAAVEFVHADMLNDDIVGEYDIVVSNPPYIAMSEGADMEAHVIMHEPYEALFVPDDDPLRYYRAISRIASRTLVPAGTLWLEINPRYCRQLADMLTSDGFDDVTAEKYLDSCNRFIIATKE